MIKPELIELVLMEHNRQQRKHGPQNYPNGTGADNDLTPFLDSIRKLCDHKTAVGTVTWTEVLLEEALECATEPDPIKLREELIQVSAVALAWASKL